MMSTRSPDERARHASGGVLVPHARLYDAIGHRFLLGSLLDGVAADVASVAGPAGRVLDVGCGPGRLSISLARRYGLETTGLDLDPAMIDRARVNTARRWRDGRRSPSFVVGDVAAIPFADRSFQVVVSTLSMHHWDDPPAGLTEIGRVLRPGGRALVWDFAVRRLPLHAGLRDPVESARASDLKLLSVLPWRWPWKFVLTNRIELGRPDGVAAAAAADVGWAADPGGPSPTQTGPESRLGRHRSRRSTGHGRSGAAR
jgi:SAM-dependent methyltransferase